ncbi:MAG: hypothetical protein KDD40_02510, partial [Bdellovibrionales bacterium]|nr:hypothetical protein [Bdellovibrionales bacterium]
MKKSFKGAFIYDGPFDFDNVDFVGFPSTSVNYKGYDFTPIPFYIIGGANRYTNVVQNLKFYPEPKVKLLYEDTNWADSPWSTSLMDLDGSLTGEPNTIVVPDHELNNHSSCVRKQQWGALLCNYQMGVIVMLSTDVGSIPFSVHRNDGAKSFTSPNYAQGILHRKFGVILDKGFEYELRFPNNTAPEELYGLVFQADLGDVSPVLKLTGMGDQCELQGRKKVTEISQLRQSTETAYYSVGKDLYVKVKANQRHFNIDSDNAPQGISSNLNIKCN